MERISTLVDGKMITVPVLTAKHIRVLSEYSRNLPISYPECLQDLRNCGLIKEAGYGPVE